jgi:hypothetical protein
MADKYKHLRPERKKVRVPYRKMKMCFLKRQYSTPEDAKQAMFGKVTKTYKCPICKCYHLTKGKKK